MRDEVKGSGVVVRFLDEEFTYMFSWTMTCAPRKGDEVETTSHATKVYMKVIRVIWVGKDECSVVCK